MKQFNTMMAEAHGKRPLPLSPPPPAFGKKPLSASKRKKVTEINKTRLVLLSTTDKAMDTL